MKKIIAIVVWGLMTFSIGATAQIKIDNTGKVGINNTAPTYWLDVAGNFRFLQSGYEVIFTLGNLYPSTGSISLGKYNRYWNELYVDYPYFTYSPTIMSDANFKNNVKDISSVSSKLISLRPVTYKLDLNKLQSNGIGQKSSDNPDQYGFLAQEIQTIFPELVTTRQDSTLGVRYTELIPILVKAYQEQQAEIESLKARITKLESK